MMRIITGSAKGIQLVTLPGEHTRPTSERAKEAIFSMLQFEMEGCRVLDLFAGSGQLCLEALSRGASFGTLCDHSKEAVEILCKNAEKTRLKDKCEIFCTDGLRFLETPCKKPYDLIFLDPPYHLGLIPKVLPLLLKNRYLSAHGKVICESREFSDLFGGDDSLKSHFEILKENRYGIACVTVMTVKGDTLQ